MINCQNVGLCVLLSLQFLCVSVQNTKASAYLKYIILSINFNITFIQGDLIDYHCFLSYDLFPSVRQDAAKCLVDLSEVTQLSIFDSKLVPRLEQFSFDQNVIL